MNGFECDLSVLRQLTGQLTEHGGAAGSVADSLGAVTADTGRPDSDEMGRIGPGAVADLVAKLRDQLVDDSGGVDACAVLYQETDEGLDRRFTTLLGRP
ncbi:hypothetical protein [Actinophytocola xanthii]|uniref:ESX-1 secretion-associated protein n=1 Tax=Actinophytocola xanthii TaxID=1912961 RepID=A0A1Q8CY72_9PSEU|nr:hypothetical protein [Actinophytocola xanthii]OLF19302.1 hypothetical protein BU204_02855 [Actinophytocola xanthii]